MRTRSLFIFFLLIMSVGAYAVGAFFPSKSGNAEISAPGVRALVARNGKQEDLVLQIGFTGKAVDFAWVVPVPTKPDVEVIDPSVFDELDRIFRPRIMPGHFSSPPVTPAQTLQQPKPVQILNLVVLPPSDPTALMRWFSDNKLYAPPATSRLIRDYASRKWYFVVARISAEQADDARWIQPVKIQFNSQRAVLPMLLSSLNSTQIITQLYVAADVVVKAPGLTESRTTGSPTRTVYKTNEFPLFTKIVTRDCQLTELRGIIDPQKVDTDIVIVPKKL